MTGLILILTPLIVSRDFFDPKTGAGLQLGRPQPTLTDVTICFWYTGNILYPYMFVYCIFYYLTAWISGSTRIIYKSLI